MSDSTMIPAASEEYEAFLPEGWADGDDIFDMASWSGSAGQADESGEGTEPEANVSAVDSTDDSNHAIGENTGAEDDQASGEEARAIEQTNAKPKIKFSAQIDHKQEDVELDEADLPTIYQKAHVTDRVKEKLAKAQPTLDKGARLAKLMGYESFDALLDSAESSYRQGEIDKLTGEGVHPEVAKELVETRAQRFIAENKESGAEEAQTAQDGRDFKAEASELLSRHQELRGKRLPDAVVNDCLVNHKPLVQAYEEYVSRQTEAENRAIKAENKTLKQNAEAARRAPVRGVSGGGTTDTKPDDPFLIGFNSDRW